MPCKLSLSVADCQFENLAKTPSCDMSCSSILMTDAQCAQKRRSASEPRYTYVDGAQVETGVNQNPILS
jgi:hypothetical protein